MGKSIAPATRNPHKPCAKQVKICVSQAAKHTKAMNTPIMKSSFLLYPLTPRGGLSFYECESVCGFF